MKKTSSTLPVINGYRLLEDWSTSGSARWSYAEKGGRQWFIKQFMAPKYKRLEDGFSAKKVESSRIRCEAFRSSQSALYDRIREANTGNIVAVSNFFSFDSVFYAVTERVDISSVSILDISEMDHDKKLVLLKVLTYSLWSLHKKGVVHADLKPDNILVKKTKTGHTLKLIDFDASFLESAPKRGEQINFDVGFVAPETICAYNDETISLTCKADIFALGLIFHLFYSGRMPEFPEEYSNACGAVLDGAALQMDEQIPGWLRQLILQMTKLEPEERPTAEEAFQALNKQEAWASGEVKKKKGFYSPVKRS